MKITDDNVLFTIIVPAYNSANFIKKNLDSVNSQTYKNYELILVDDGSTDETLQICTNYAKQNSKIKVIHKENGGHTSARNVGLKIAKGEYVLFLDSDDWLDYKTLEVCYNIIIKNNPDIIAFNMKYSSKKIFPNYNIKDGYYDGNELIHLMNKSLIMGSNGKFLVPKSLSGKCFRKKNIFGKQISIPKKILIGEDGLAFISAMLDANSFSVIKNSEHVCYNILVRSGSVSHFVRKVQIDEIKELINAYKFFLQGKTAKIYFQYCRYLVEIIYFSINTLLICGANNKDVNTYVDELFAFDTIKNDFIKSKFNLCAYKMLIKKYIIKYRLWGISRLINKGKKKNESNNFKK